MHSLLLLANNVSSFALVIACWWLAHSYAAAGYPYGRAIAALWGVVGISVALTAFARNLYINPDPFIVTTKCVLVALCVLIARRVTLNKKRIQRAEAEPLTDY